MQDKAKIEQQAEKIQSYELSIVANKESETIQAKEMEDRIDKRVKKILDQERDLMNQQKRINQEKLKNQDMKINTLKQQLKDAKEALNKQKEKGVEQRDDTVQSTLNKLINSEKNLEELKVMYHNLNQTKESMKKDLFVLDKKYKKAQQKNKNLDNDLKTTREQVSEFKQRFRTLSTFIQKKGGIDVLNSLPNVNQGDTPNSAYGNGDDSSLAIRSNNKKISLRGQAPSQNPAFANKVVMRGQGVKNGLVTPTPDGTIAE